MACKSQRDQSAQVTITNRRTDCPVVTMNGTQLPVKNKVKYLGLILDQKLTWRPHITTKKTQINLKLRQMYWLIGRKSKLTTENHKAIIKHMVLRCITLGLCQAFKHKNHTKSTVKNTKNGVQCTMVRKQ
jgi:hypothetical protein